MSGFSALLAHRTWWLTAHSLVALGVVAALRFLDGVDIESLSDVGWTVAAAAVLTLGTVSLGLLAAVVVKAFLSRRSGFFAVLQCMSSVILLLLSAAMIIQG